MPESAYEKARRHSGSNDWEYGQLYNTAGKLNPRMSSCFGCGQYHEQDELTFNDKVEDYLCPTCHADETEPNPEIVERRSGGYPTI